MAETVGRTYRRRTPNTLTSLAALLANLGEARRTGIALDNEEHTQGICAAGVMVRDMAGNPLAVSVPVPSARFADHHAGIAERLLAAKSALEQLFGTGRAR